MDEFEAWLKLAVIHVANAVEQPLLCIKSQLRNSEEITRIDYVQCVCFSKSPWSADFVSFRGDDNLEPQIVQMKLDCVGVPELMSEKEVALHCARDHDQWGFWQASSCKPSPDRCSGFMRIQVLAFEPVDFAKAEQDRRDIQEARLAVRMATAANTKRNTSKVTAASRSRYGVQFQKAMGGQPGCTCLV